MGNAQGQGPEDKTSAASQHHEKHAHTKTDHKKQKKFCGCLLCMKILFLVMAIMTILESLSVIVVSVTTAVASKIYHSDQSGRLVALAILMVTAFTTVAVIIYALIGIFRAHQKPLYVAAIVLALLAVIQAIIAGAAVNVKSSDEASLAKSLRDSFEKSSVKNSKQHQIWAITQHDLSCCGVDGPKDYRVFDLPQYFPPNVPISCCPSYDPNRSELVQERQREVCRAKKLYHDLGCKDQLVQVFKEAAKTVVSATVILIIFEVVLAIQSGIFYKKLKNCQKKEGPVQKI